MSAQPTAVLGAGAWGTALAVMLARSGVDTTLCVRRQAQFEALARDRENRAYLPGVTLPDSLRLAIEWPDAVAGAGTVVMAVPSRYARAALSRVAQSVRSDAVLVNAVKGIEDESLKTMTEMMAVLVPHARACAVLSGPGFAAEVAPGKPAALVAASRVEEAAWAIQHLFASRSLRIYRSTDVTGVELAGAAKNVIAIAAGVSDGLELGSSARAAVITRGLAELARLVEAAGGRRDTVMGLAGLGDLVLTCTGELSRNRSLGLALGRSGNVKGLPAQQEGRPVAEGVSNARAIRRLAARHRVEMPIVDAVYRTLYEGEPPKAMVEELLSRSLKAEF